MKIIAVYNIKGGVGKTATVVNLSYLAAKSGANTLICDLDPQGSATYYFRIKPKFKKGRKGFIKGGKSIEQNIKGTDYLNLDLLPADFSFRNLDLALDNVQGSKRRLAKIFQSLKKEYDYIFIDCPPNITIVAENVFNAADGILVPVIPTTLSIRCLQQLLTFFTKSKYDTSKLMPFFSMVESRKTMHKNTISRASRQFNHFLRTRILYRAVIEKMGITREPVQIYSPNSIAAKTYQKLWRELHQRMS